MPAPPYSTGKSLHAHGFTLRRRARKGLHVELCELCEMLPNEAEQNRSLMLLQPVSDLADRRLIVVPRRTRRARRILEYDCFEILFLFDHLRCRSFRTAFPNRFMIGLIEDYFGPSPLLEFHLTTTPWSVAFSNANFECILRDLRALRGKSLHAHGFTLRRKARKGLHVELCELRAFARCFRTKQNKIDR